MFAQHFRFPKQYFKKVDILPRAQKKKHLAPMVAEGPVRFFARKKGKNMPNFTITHGGLVRYVLIYFFDDKFVMVHGKNVVIPIKNIVYNVGLPLCGRTNLQWIRPSPHR